MVNWQNKKFWKKGSAEMMAFISLVPTMIILFALLASIVQVTSFKEKLEYTGVPILGVVLNKVERKKNSGYYNKYYGKEYKKDNYEGYYSSDEKKK